MLNFALFTEDESGPKPEALNKKAVAIVNRVRDKLTGTFSPSCQLLLAFSYGSNWINHPKLYFPVFMMVT